MGIVEGEGGRWPLVWIMLGVGLNNSMDLDRDSSCWGLVLCEEVRLLVGLSGGGGWLVLGEITGRGMDWASSGSGAKGEGL